MPTSHSDKDGSTEDPMAEEIARDQSSEDRQVEAAAIEAARIGGVAGDEGIEAAQRPVSEAGGGVAEGFEAAEELLVEHASHGDQQPAHTVLHDQGRDEEVDTSAEYAEADRELSSEVPGQD